MDDSHDFDRFWERYPKEIKTVDSTSLELGLFQLPFKEGDIVKCVKNTFDSNRECIGKYFCLTATNARELNDSKTSSILNSYPSGENNEFGINYTADFLIISARSETILNNNFNILQHESTHIQTTSTTYPGADCSIQGTIYRKPSFPQIRCGY